MAQANDAPANIKLQSKDIYIDGKLQDKGSEVVRPKIEVEDEELNFFKSELENVKNLNKSFKIKSKTLAKMAEEAEQLKEQHLDYIENRVEWETTIDDYNKQADCMAKSPKDCVKFLGRDRHSKKDDRRYRNNEGPSQERQQASEVPLSDMMMPLGAGNSLVAAQGKKGFDSDQFVAGVDSVIAANADLLDDCLSRYAKGTRDFSVVYAQLTINRAGALSHLGIENPEAIPNRNVLSCMSTVLHSLVYPKVVRETKVRKPFSFIIRRS